MSYIPRPGSVTSRALAMLEAEGPLALAVIGERLGQDANTVRGCLQVPLCHGVVKRERDPKTWTWLYSLGDGDGLQTKQEKAEPEDFPSQKTVPASSVSPGVDIDAVHRNSPWHVARAREFALIEGKLRISVGDVRLTLDLERTRELRKLLTGAA